MKSLIGLCIAGAGLLFAAACSEDTPNRGNLSDAGRIRKDAGRVPVGNEAGHRDPNDSGLPDVDSSTIAADAASDSGIVHRPDSGTEPGIRLESLRTLEYPAPPVPAENPHSKEKAMLGKILFWEEQLSSDNTVACGTCHRPAAGGADPRSEFTTAHLPGPDNTVGTDDDVQGSPGLIRCDASGTPTGDTVQVTGRRAPSYLDAMFAPRLFWDGRAECAAEECPSPSAFEDPDNPGVFPIASGAALEIQAVGPPLNDVEMACEQRTWADLHAKLRDATPLALASDIPEDLAQFIAAYEASYPALFEAAFGDEQSSGAPDEINTRRIAFAIATHERTLRSNQTPWDKFNAGDDDALSPQQIRGLQVFHVEAKCGSCHLPPLFTDGAFHFTGFYDAHKSLADAGPTDPVDRGRGAITGNEFEWGKHRTPTLRNVALREAGGLLHNGGGHGASLQAVLEVYSKGGRRDVPAIAAHIPATVEEIQLNEQDLEDLTEFLVNGLTDPRVAQELPPFDRPKLSTE